jgi:hypothetical protein
MRRSELTGIVQVAAMKRKDVGNTRKTSERISYWPCRQDEMRIDHIKAVAPEKSASSVDAHWDECQHRKQAGDGLLSSEEDRCSNDSDTCFNSLPRQAQAL